MFKKVSLVLALVLAAGILFAGCTKEEAPPADQNADADASWTAIQDKGEFILGLDDAFPPMGFKGESGEIEGFDIDLAKAVAEKLGVGVTFQPIDWNSKELELQNGNIDVVWNGLTMNQERIDSGKWGFSQPYLENTQVIVSLESTNIKTIADLTGKVVGVQLDSSAQAAVEGKPEVLASFKNGEVIKTSDYMTLLLDLKAGNLDAIVGDEILVKYMMQKDVENAKPGDPVLVLADENLGEEFYAIGFRVGDDAFIAEVNRALNELIEDGTAAEISKKWFGDDIVYVPSN